MAFHDVRFPLCIEIGAVGGPRFKTTVLTLGSGREQRNIEWARVRGAWDVASGVKTKADMEDMVAFFYAREGRAHGFRFRDWNDYHIGAAGAPLQIGTGDGTETEFPLVKRYTSGAYYYARKITRPVSGSVVVSHGGSPSISSSVNYDTGLITFSAPVPNGVPIYAYGEFDCAVRFDQDELDITGLFDDVQHIASIRIVELKE